MSKENILLIGGGGHCRSCIDVIEQEGKYTIIGIIDTPDKVGQEILGYEIIGTDADISKFLQPSSNALVTIGQIGSGERRTILFYQLVAAGFQLPVIISPLAYVSPSSSIGAGTIVMHQALVNSNAVIGQNCIINTKALVEHDCIIEDYCHIATGAIINGGVKIGSNTFIGSGSITKQGITVPSNSFIKAASLIK